MSYLKYIAMLGVLFLGAAAASAQVSVGIGVGGDYGYSDYAYSDYGPAPVCSLPSMEHHMSPSTSVLFRLCFCIGSQIAGARP